MEAYMNPGKEYVQVSTDWLEDGQVIPRSLVLKGRLYKIDRVLSRQLIKKDAPDAPRVPGEDPRPRRGNVVEADTCEELTVLIGGQKTHLYFERWPSLGSNYMGRWFVLLSSRSGA